MSNQITSMIRIGIAAAVGVAVKLLTEQVGLDVDGETLTAALTGAAISLYYSFARWAEARWPAIRFLGLADPSHT